MDAQLDLDDVAATSYMAKQELAAMRAENQRMREALEGMINKAQKQNWDDNYPEQLAKARAALGEE